MSNEQQADHRERLDLFSRLKRGGITVEYNYGTPWIDSYPTGDIMDIYTVSIATVYYKTRYLVWSLNTGTITFTLIDDVIHYLAELNPNPAPSPRPRRRR